MLKHTNYNNGFYDSRERAGERVSRSKKEEEEYTSMKFLTKNIFKK